MYKGTLIKTNVTRGYNYELKHPVPSGTKRKVITTVQQKKEDTMNNMNDDVKEPVVRVRMSVEFNFPEANEWLMFHDIDYTKPILQLVPLLVTSLQEIVDGALDATDDDEEYRQFSLLDEALDYYVKETETK